MYCNLCDFYENDPSMADTRDLLIPGTPCTQGLLYIRATQKNEKGGNLKHLTFNFGSVCRQQSIDVIGYVASGY